MTLVKSLTVIVIRSCALDLANTKQISIKGLDLWVMRSSFELRLFCNFRCKQIVNIAALPIDIWKLSYFNPGNNKVREYIL